VVPLAIRGTANSRERREHQSGKISRQRLSRSKRELITKFHPPACYITSIRTLRHKARKRQLAMPTRLQIERLLKLRTGQRSRLDSAICQCPKPASVDSSKPSSLK
jgi:hypothetical protein